MKKIVFALVSVVILATVMFSSPAHAALLYRQLEIGMTGSDVSDLQTFLAQDPSIYPRGLVTGYFGPLTRAAVVNFQIRNGISAVGRVGPITLAAINQRMGGGTVGTDVYSPIISNRAASVTQNGAVVTWSTNESARGKVYFQTSFPAMTEANAVARPVISGTVAEESTFGTQHSVSLAGLQRATDYYFVVESVDARGNIGLTWPTTFRTQ